MKIPVDRVLGQTPVPCRNFLSPQNGIIDANISESQ